jgi:hypothetical protein
MMTTITTSVTLVVGDVIFIDDERMKVVESLGSGVYGIRALTEWERWWLRTRSRWHRLRRLLHRPRYDERGYCERCD